MKKFTIFESAIIGLLVGVVVSAYVLFLTNTGGFVGTILGWVSLLPLAHAFNFPADMFLVCSFLFVVCVYVLYGVILGFIVKKMEKRSITLIVLIILLPISVCFEQWMCVRNKKISEDVSESASVSNSIFVPKPIEQYFGTEAYGDLNGDGKNDVAFIIPRNDGTNNTVYYVAAAMKSQNGHTGTNLLFLGSKVLPRKLTIENSVIIVDYNNDTDKTSTTTKQMYAQVIDGILKQVASLGEENNATTTVSNESL